MHIYMQCSFERSQKILIQYNELLTGEKGYEKVTNN